MTESTNNMVQIEQSDEISLYPEFNLVSCSDGKWTAGLSRKTDGCKAYMWDDLQILINKGSIPIESLRVAWRVSSKSDNNNFSARLSKIEGILNFQPTLFYETAQWGGYKVLIFIPDPKWYSCVELFSLFLATIRYWNFADKSGMDRMVESPNDLLNYLKLINLDDYKHNWRLKKAPRNIYSETGYYSMHSEGIMKFYSTKKGYVLDER